MCDPLGDEAESAAPERAGAEAGVLLGADRSSDSPTTPTSKALPEVEAAKSTEEPLTVGVSEALPQEEHVRSSPEPKALAVKGLPAGADGATGKRNLNLGRLASPCMCR